MCTVTWLHRANGYDVLFNRDEKYSRSPGTPPRLRRLKNISSLYPTDPDQKGTWLGVNEFGLTFGLLNFYPPKSFNHSPSYHSRGAIIKNLLTVQNLSSVKKTIQNLPLKEFRAFTLMAFSKKKTKAFRWDGERLKEISFPSQSGPVTSSSVQTDKAIETRVKTFRSMKTRTLSELISYQHSHKPRKGALSVCVHRADGGSVSWNHISVRDGKAIFAYKSGSPCEGGRLLRRSISLR